MIEGRGAFSFDNRSNGLAHRASYKIFKGELDKSLFILHSCNKRACVNPDHLRQGTSAEKARYQVLAGMCGKTPKGKREV